MRQNTTTGHYSKNRYLIIICPVKILSNSNANEIPQWEVDTGSKDKVLTVTSDGATEQQVIDIVKQAGFKIEAINS